MNTGIQETVENKPVFDPDSDKMADTTMEELNIEEFEKKEDTVSFKEEILLSSTLEAKFTVNLHKDDIKIENTGIQGKK